MKSATDQADLRARSDHRRAQREEMIRRILSVARYDPEISVNQLAVRFKVNPETVRRILRGAP